jgi:hypothetical protein
MHSAAAGVETATAPAKVETATATAEVSPTTAPEVSASAATAAEVSTTAASATAAEGLGSQWRRNGRQGRQHDCANHKSLIFHEYLPELHRHVEPVGSDAQ